MACFPASLEAAVVVVVVVVVVASLQLQLQLAGPASLASST